MIRSKLKPQLILQCEINPISKKWVGADEIAPHKENRAQSAVKVTAYAFLHLLCFFTNKPPEKRRIVPREFYAALNVNLKSTIPTERPHRVKKTFSSRQRECNSSLVVTAKRHDALKCFHKHLNHWIWLPAIKATESQRNGGRGLASDDKFKVYSAAYFTE